MTVLLQGCATVDIRSSNLKQEGMDAALMEKGRRILAQAVWKQDRAGKWDQFDEWKIVTRDVWRSNLIRRLTPITQADQKLEFLFRLDKTEAQLKYLNGKKAHEVLGIANGQSYVWQGTERVFKKNGRLEGYLAPVRDYFFWPQDLVNSEYIAYDGEVELDGIRYHKIFATNGSFTPSSGENQYIVWINTETLQIDYIEFTLRELLKSYRGVVQYKDYQVIEGIGLPQRIVLKDKLSGQKYSHEFIVEGMEFSEDQKELSFTIQLREFDGSL
ncbi:MAG: hypothetical protein K8I00_13190 [Candidatus Omnitrophica bacterium]|nr:hypothetical protein [Candidatus Omnitrophota bacterium]